MVWHIRSVKKVVIGLKTITPMYENKCDAVGFKQTALIALADLTGSLTGWHHFLRNPVGISA